MRNSAVTILMTVLLMSGCAVGVKHDYGQTALDLGVATPATVAVGTVDQRSYVVDGRKSPNFVGVTRGGFGNPFDVMTQSGKPLATDISDAVVASMRAKGVNAKAVELRPTDNALEAGNALRAAGVQRSVVITLQEWKSDAMVNTGLAYSLELRVLDREGRPLVTKARQGAENLGSGDPFRPGGGAQVLPRFQRMMETLFREPDVVKALQP
jgi:hypothetical protein